MPIERSTRDHARVAPHNVFGEPAGIAERRARPREGVAPAISAGHSQRPIRHCDSAPTVADPKAKIGNDTFSFDYSGGSYVVKWRGQTYTDGDSGKTATTDNVVVM